MLSVFCALSHHSPDCLQFCRPCVAKAASLLRADFSLYHVSATTDIFVSISCSRSTLSTHRNENTLYWVQFDMFVIFRVHAWDGFCLYSSQLLLIVRNHPHPVTLIQVATLHDKLSPTSAFVLIVAQFVLTCLITSNRPCTSVKVRDCAVSV